jgi:hypothetical protein
MPGDMGNGKSILLAEDDARDAELTLAALAEHDLAGSNGIFHGRENVYDEIPAPYPASGG